MIKIKKLISSCEGNELLILAVWKEILRLEGGPKTFSEWTAVRKANLPKEIGQQAIPELFKTASGYWDFDLVRLLVNPKSPVYRRALEGMARQAKSISEWRRIFQLSPEGSALERRSAEAIANLLIKGS